MRVVLFTLAGHAFRAEETCAGDRVTEVVFPEFNLVARVKTESPVDKQMRFADTSDNKADPREVGLFVNLRVSGVPGWRVFAGRDVGDWQESCADMKVGRKRKCRVLDISRRVVCRVCIC